MIRAFARTVADCDNSFLVIVGDGEMRVELELLVNDLKIQDRVLFTGYQSDPKAIMSAFDVFLLSSLSEGTSMTLLEAMSLGKPCVVTDAGGNSEVIEHGFNGVVCENNNEQAFAKACLSIMHADFEQYRINSLARFNKTFSVITMQAHFNKIWYNLC